MKKSTSYNVKATVIIITILVLTSMISLLPWWSFIIPVFGFGLFMHLKKWEVSFFLVSFFSGFLVWFGGNLLYSLSHNGIMLTKTGHLFSVPPLIVMIISGIIGGVLTWLSVYLGQSIIDSKNDEYPIF